MNETMSAALSPYTVLDLSEGGFNWCGKLLADLGADVVKAEPPGGSPTRRRGPFVRARDGSPRSLFWAAYCANKRGIELDLSDPEGADALRNLARGADILIESFAPGRMDALGLGYDRLARENPALIYASITPFGQTGPYAQYAAPDLVAWAMGGMAYVCGDADRPPVRVSAPQAELHAAAHAAAGIMAALWHRQAAGEGQRVDVSMQTAVIWTLMNATPFPPLHGVNVERDGAFRSRGALAVRQVFRCADGHASAVMSPATLAGIAEWMDEDGEGPLWLRETDWREEWNIAASAAAEADPDAIKRFYAVQRELEKFFATRSKRALYDRALSHRLLIAPCQTVEDIARCDQLAARDFWRDLSVPELDAPLTHLGPFIKMSETPIQIARPAPNPGEHNREILITPKSAKAETRNASDADAEPNQSESAARRCPSDSQPVMPASRPVIPAKAGIQNPADANPPTANRRYPSDSRPVIPAKAETHKPADANSPTAARRYPFEGVRILDFTWVGVGPITIKHLADFGADVIRIESASRLDVLRNGAPFKDGEPGINRSQFSANYNTSKRGLGLNLATPEGRELARELIREWKPDIIAESFTPRVMPDWGLAYEDVRRIVPDVIYFSTCQLGQTGPRAAYAGFGQLAGALAGFYQLVGWADRDPAGPYGAYSDFVNPPNAAAAIAAALEYRRRTGRGQRLDLSQYECAAHFLAPAIMDCVANGEILNRRGNEDDEAAPHGVYPCADRERKYTGVGQSWIAIAVSEQSQWRALCECMRRPDLADDPRFADPESRRAHSAELDAAISEWTRPQDARALMDELQANGVPAGVVQSQADLWEDPQIAHRGFFQWLDHAECGPMPYDGLTYHLSKTPGELRMPQALIGQHNSEILREILGMDETAVGELLANGVLEVS